MLPMIEPTLYLDVQREKPGGLCRCCGGELYAPGFTCLRCERRNP